MKTHIDECAASLRCWGDRRREETKSPILQPQDICATLARLEALFRALFFLESRFGFNLTQAKILDVGSSYGYGLIPFLFENVPAANLHGIDLFPERIKEGLYKFPALNLRSGDATEMPYPGADFDIVLEQFCFCHIMNDEIRRKIAGEMMRVLRPGGFIIVHDWTVGSAKRHYNGVSIANSLDLFPGFEIVKVFPSQLFPPVGRILSRYAPGLYSLVRNLFPILALSKMIILRPVK